MALHNYIYSKHQTDVTTNNKIAREHEPRPVYLDAKPDPPNVGVIDTASKGTGESDSTDLVDHNHHGVHINHRASQIIYADLPDDHHMLRLHEAGGSIDVKGTYEDELANEGNEDEEEDSSDSDFLRAQARRYENQCQRHGNYHNNMNQLYPHPPAQSVIEDVDERHEDDTIIIVKPSSDQSDKILSMENGQAKISKWVFVNGKKIKLRSRFSRSETHKLSADKVVH